MSNPLAIAAVTTALRELLRIRLQADVTGAQVTTHPLDRARFNSTGNQVNLFLYHTGLDPAFRNADMPRQVKPGETGQPPLPLILHYLLTAYSDDDASIIAHRLLGQAMSVLHDQPLLFPADIVAAANAEQKTDLSGQDLHEQVERVRITPLPLNLEEMSKLWTTFQTQYRVSAAYEVAVVLIDSRRPVRAPLPVLSRGPDDRGPVAAADTGPPLPTLDGVDPPRQEPTAALGDTLTLRGHRLGGDGATVVVRFETPRRADPVDETPPPESIHDDHIQVKLPSDRPADVPAGFWTVRVVFRRAGEPDRTTNEVPLMVAPEITTPLPITVTRAGGRADVTLDVTPPVLPAQRAYLLLGGRQIAAAARTAPRATLTFSFPVAAAERGGLIRVRVDGVDTRLVDRSGATPVFRDQRVIIQ